MIVNCRFLVNNFHPGLLITLSFHMDSEDSEYSKLYACIYSTFVPFEGKTSWIKQNKSLSWSYYVRWPFRNLFLCFFIKFREWLFFRVLVPLHAAAERWLLNCWPGQSTSTGWWVWLEICVNFLSGCVGQTRSRYARCPSGLSAVTPATN